MHSMYVVHSKVKVVWEKFYVKPTVETYEKELHVSPPESDICFGQNLGLCTFPTGYVCMCVRVYTYIYMCMQNANLQ